MDKDQPQIVNILITPQHHFPQRERQRTDLGLKPPTIITKILSSDQKDIEIAECTRRTGCLKMQLRRKSGESKNRSVMYCHATVSTIKRGEEG